MYLYGAEDKIWTDIMEAAAAAGVPRNTLDQWRFRGFVPPSRHFEIVEHAARIGVASVTHKKLHNMWKHAKENNQ